MPTAFNLLSAPERRTADEILTDILVRPGCRIEHIISSGQTTPPDRPHLQSWDEWVLVLQGAARISMGGEEFALEAGDHHFISAGVAHWVTFTQQDPPTIWLAVHFDSPLPAVGDGTGEPG